MRSTICRLGLSLASVGFWMAAQVRGGPPFITDDPEPVPKGHWEFYVASRLENEGGNTTATLPEIEINYGVIENVQLHTIFPFVLNDPNGGSSEYGFGDAELGFKFRFIQETEKIPQVAIFPLVLLPTGDEDKGLGNGKVQFFLPLWLQKSWGEWTTYGGGGYATNNADGAKDHWLFGWEIQRKLGEHWILGGEIFHQTADEEGADPHTGFNLGGFYNINENHHILFSFGTDIDGDTDFRSYIAYQLTF